MRGCLGLAPGHADGGIGLAALVAGARIDGLLVDFLGAVFALPWSRLPDDPDRLACEVVEGDVQGSALRNLAVSVEVGYSANSHDFGSRRPALRAMDLDSTARRWPVLLGGWGLLFG